MQSRTFALVLSATLLGAGCASQQTQAPAPAPIPQAEVKPAKPICPPEPTAKIKSKKSKKSKKATPPPQPIDCEPAPQSPATTTSKAAPAAAPVAAAPVTATATTTAKSNDPSQPRMMKSTDGTFEGEVYGNIPANSKWAKLQIGMMQPEVERILGGTSSEIRTHPTGKAFIPFYFGTDRYRYEVVYRGQGSVSYTGGSWGGGQGVLMMINYDPNI